MSLDGAAIPEAKPDETTRKPAPVRRFLRAIAISMVALAVIGSLISFYLRWADPDREIKLVNFLVAWWPFAVSVFVAFIPDIEKRGHAMTWRIGIIVLGLGYSVLLWHQQSLSIGSARQDQATLLASANKHTDDTVSNANKHTDETVDKASKHTDDDLKEVREHSDRQIENLRGEVKSIGDAVAKSSASLGESISKVGKPDPPAPPKIRFSLWGDGRVDMNNAPLTTYEMKPDVDGVFNVEVGLVNASTSAANQLDIWVHVCDACQFAKEPSGFEKPNGIDEHARHRSYPGSLNPGVGFEKLTIPVKLKDDPGASFFVIGFNYTCANCGGISETQILTVRAAH